MKYTKILMGMPVTVEVVSERVPRAIFEKVYDLFRAVDERFSTYRADSEVSRINQGLGSEFWSDEVKEVLALSEQTKRVTEGYFDVYHSGRLDPSGLVKGWAIERAAQLLVNLGYYHFYVEAGGDIQTYGHGSEGRAWRVGIRSPFRREEIVKVLALDEAGVATSGAYIRGAHIYNPHTPGKSPSDVASITVVGPNIYEADRFATAAYAMGLEGARFIESREGLEAYMIDMQGMATMTTGFERYVAAV